MARRPRSLSPTSSLVSSLSLEFIFSSEWSGSLSCSGKCCAAWCESADDSASPPRPPPKKSPLESEECGEPPPAWKGGSCRLRQSLLWSWLLALVVHVDERESLRSQWVWMSCWGNRRRLAPCQRAARHLPENRSADKGSPPLWR
jgi:hypothetical protein